ncbi:uncharacterized protein [Penaeus vannamei]|uniref:uncharacterized protein isoform X2 n=1 Tax=Penaeus vannamei TaxID=6689 RepID=UPI00387F69C3
MPHTPRKALKVTTEIDVHAVSCPGVWLPGRGRCSLSVCLLGFHTRTNKLPPVFPLLYHEKFKFERTFVGVTNLSVLERVLESETVYLELVQEETSGESVLAVFESSVRDLLFPRPAERLSYSGVDLDLLMEPTRDFPGIISPKIEVSTRTSVSETRTPLHQCEQDTVSFGHAQNRATKAVFRPKSPDEGRKGDGGGSSEGGGGGGGSGGALVRGEEEPLPLQTSPRHGESSRGSGRRDEGPRPRFVYRRPDDDLLSRIPSSPTRNNNRYLSRSTGNLSDMPRTALPSRYGSRQGRTDSGGGLARTSSETEGGGGGYTHPRRRAKDDLGHDAHVTLVEPERCPHCDGEHGAESCTTCRTYHRYFPRPSRPRAHAHAYHTNNPQAALKVLRQPGRRDLRPRKRYLAEIDGALHGEALRHPRRARSLSPQRRPTSAPPDRLDLGHSRSRKDDDDDPSADEDEHESRSHSRSNSRSNSRSPSPPASHASAPATMTRRRQRSYRRPLTPSFRRRHDDSDDDLYDDLYIPRRYYHHHYPWEDCPLCYPDYPYLPRYPHLARYYRYSYRSPYRCYCSTCVRYRLYRPYSYLYKYRPCRFSCYPYRPLHHYTRTYLDSCDLLDDDDLNPRSSYKLPKLKVTSSNPKDGTSEDSDLLDGSQVEEIQRGMNKKSQSSKQESWTKSKVKMGDASGDSAGGGRERQHEEGKAPSKEGGLGKESQSSGEFFDLD